MSQSPSPSGFETPFIGFKEQAAQFFRRLKEPKILTQDQIEGALSALNLAYVYCEGTQNEKHQSAILIALIHKHGDAYKLKHGIPL